VSICLGFGELSKELEMVTLGRIAFGASFPKVVNTGYLTVSPSALSYERTSIYFLVTHFLTIGSTSLGTNLLVVGLYSSSDSFWLVFKSLANFSDFLSLSFEGLRDSSTITFDSSVIES
jgi:hypothetical protein